MVVSKFRAWHKPMQRMSEVLAISYERQKVKIRHLRGTTHMTVLFDDVELMQSTGLVDKNGQEIFEGDIVHAYSEDARLIGAIEYFDNAYCIKTKNGVYNSLWINAEYYEVIGNIYENPELLFKNLPEDDRQLTDFPTCPVCDERTYSEDTCPFWSSEWSVDKALNGGLL